MSFSPPDPGRPPPPPPSDVVRTPAAQHGTRPGSSAAVARAPGSSGPLKVVGNVLWLILGGIWLALGYVIAGIIQCITIIGIPFGLQSFKLAGYALWPFGRVVVQRHDRDVGLSCLGNGLWFVLSGVWLALAHLVVGIVLCITIIGIPFGIASFKLAGLALAPFGKEVVPAGSPLPQGSSVYLAV